jgi:hypothetical protein
MEIENLIAALEGTLSYLRKSESSDWTQMKVEEIIAKLETEIVEAKSSHRIDTQVLRFLFAPTGAIQETSIENGWAKEFLQLSEVVDQFIEKSN